jgi:methyltransferase (TIGR00027 family)
MSDPNSTSTSQSSSPSERSPSATALGVAWLRAVHQVRDGMPKLLDDPIAFRLLEPNGQEALLNHLNRNDDPISRGLRSHVVLRSRYAEDCLEEACRRGVEQLVVLGAGYDTFAYRQPAWAQRLQIFEVDHPASQRAKRQRLTAAGIEVPSNAEWVGIDFETVALSDGLRASRFDFARPSFFSWLGVTMYLTLPAIEAVFRFVASLPRSSELVFTFSPKEGESSPMAVLAAQAAAVGEPWRTHLEPSWLSERLTSLGFSRIEMPTTAELTERYYRDRTDGLPPPRRSTLARAIV